MSMLRRLRGEPRFSRPFLGQTLTFYRQGARLGMFVALATFILSNLPWHLVGSGGQMLRLSMTAVGCYFAATLIASRTPARVDAHEAATRWL